MSESGSIKVLVVRDNRSKAVFAHTVPVQGADEGGFAVKAIVDDVVWLGYTKLVLKTDNEPAILKLLQESLRDLRSWSEVGQRNGEDDAIRVGEGIGVPSACEAPADCLARPTCGQYFELDGQGP